MLLRYSVRSLWHRRTDTVVSVVIIAAVIWSCLISIGFIGRFEEALLSSGSNNNAVVLQRSARRETFSLIPLEQVNLMRAFTGVAKADGRDLNSPEYVGHVLMRGEVVGEMLIPLRGVDPIAYLVHPHVEVTAGRKPQDGAREVMIGEQASRLFGIKMGDTVPLGGQPWQVVGTFRARGSNMERELWTSRYDAQRAFRREEMISSVIFTLTGPGELDNLKKYLASRNELKLLEAYAEPEHRASEENALAAALTWVSSVVIAIALGAIFGATNSLQAMMLRRLPQFTTLIILGIRRRRVATMVITEGLLIGALAGLLGAILMEPLGKAFRLPDLFASSIEIQLATTPQILAVGLGLGLLIGIAGALSPAVVLMRARLLDQVR
jgi:ABC-type lipoprotein release transport system permease subunit